MALTPRAKTILGIGATAVLAVAFEIALLVNVEPLPPSGPLAASLDRAIDRLQAAPHGAPGIAVAIAENGTIAYAHESGFADLTSRAAVTPHTAFRAGSLAKMFTAVAVMQLVESGAVELDASVSRYVGDAPHGDAITVRQLLQHASGLPDYTDALSASGPFDQPTTPFAILAPIATTPLEFAPGSRYEYSNTNFVVLGEVVENVSGQHLAEVFATRILQPAGMAETAFGSNPGLPVATGYAGVNGGDAKMFDPTWLYGSADVITTASDVARFDIALMDGRLVRPATLRRIERETIATDAAGSRFGLGFRVDAFGSRTLLGETGGLPGFEAENELAPAQRFAVVVLGNATSLEPGAVDQSVLATLFPTDFVVAEASANGDHSRQLSALDPSVERVLRGFLATVGAQNLDTSTLTPQMAQSMTPEAQSQFTTSVPPYATLKSLDFLGRSQRGTSTIYIFDATYASRTIAYQIELDPGGKLASIVVR